MKFNKPAVLNTSQGTVPSKESGQESEYTTSLLKSKSGRGITHISRVLLAGEEEESQVEGEEEGEEHDSRPESANQQQSGKDEPASQEEANWT